MGGDDDAGGDIDDGGDVNVDAGVDFDVNGAVSLIQFLFILFISSLLLGGESPYEDADHVDKTLLVGEHSLPVLIGNCDEAEAEEAAEAETVFGAGG